MVRFRRLRLLRDRSSRESATEPRQWRPARWVVPLFGLGAVALVPWVALLVVVLPSDHRAAHWDVAWAGFDIALALLLLTVALAAWRQSPWLEGAATAAATLLFADAWFDVLTSSSQAELVVSLVEAVFLELPLAVLCLLLARDAERFLRPRLAPAESAAPHLRLLREERVAVPPPRDDRLSA